MMNGNNTQQINQMNEQQRLSPEGWKDLMKHIQMKMRYNAMRPRLHGKAY